MQISKTKCSFKMSLDVVFFYFSIFFPISTNIAIPVFTSFLRYCRFENFILLNLTPSGARNKIFPLSHVSILSNYSWLLLLDTSSSIFHSSKEPCLWHISPCSYHLIYLSPVSPKLQEKKKKKISSIIWFLFLAHYQNCSYSNHQ